MMAYRRYRRSYYSLRDIGHERARKHIEDYHRLEAELGGSLDDVKQYFFSLNPGQLRQILLAYGQRYGKSARDYAEKTIENWKNNRVHMAGQTAERLFRLLPMHMPLEKKYQLIENLWSHVGATTRKTLRIGLDVSTEQVIAAVRKHLDEVVVQHRIPTTLEGRFNWLAAGDAQVKQDLLNHLRQHMEKNLVVEAARLQLPIMQDHLRSDLSRQTFRLAQILKLGNHELELLIDKKANGVAIIDPHLASQSIISRAACTARAQAVGFKWLWWAVAAAVAWYLLAGPQTHGPSYQPSTLPSYQPSTPTVPLRRERSLPTASQPSAPLTRQSDLVSDHGPGRVACDAQWSGLQKPDSAYQDFMRDCMSRNPQ